MTQCAHGEFLNRTADVHLGAVLTLSVLVPHAAMHPCSSWWRKAEGGRAPRAQHTHSPLSPSSAHTPFYLQTAHTLCTSICCRCDLLWIGLGELCANGMADFNSCSLAAVSSIKNALFTKPAITWTAQKKESNILMSQLENQKCVVLAQCQAAASSS